MSLPIPHHHFGRIDMWQGLAMRLACCVLLLALASAGESCGASELSNSCAAESTVARASSLLQLQRAKEGTGKTSQRNYDSLEGMDGFDGLMAPLTEEGYERVAALQSSDQMNQFIRRTVSNLGFRVVRPQELHNVVPRYSGVVAAPLSFAALQTEILKSSIEDNSWITERSSGRRVDESNGKSSDPSDEAQFTQPVAGLISTDSRTMASSSSEVEKPRSQVSLEGSDTSVRALSDSGFGSEIQGSLADKDTGLGAAAHLDEAGYNEVLQMKNNYEMEVFVRRTVESLNLAVVDEKALKTSVPWLSGEAGSSTFGNLKGKILNMLGKPNAWVSDPNAPPPPMKGADAPLSEEGMVFASNLRSNIEMVSFINRVADSMGLKVVNTGGPEGLAPFFSGDKQVGTLQSLRQEIHKAAQTTGSWVREKDGDM